jgi:hypothetical protein
VSVHFLISIFAKLRKWQVGVGEFLLENPLHKFEVRRVHIVPLIGRRRATVKDMTQMGPAPCAEYLDPEHLRSSFVFTFSFATGAEKLTQPVPDPDLSFESKRSVPQQAHR